MSESKDDFFSLDNFKKWMKEQKEVETPKQKHNVQYIGHFVESKIRTKRLIDFIEIKEGEDMEVVADFLKNGGTVADVDGNNFLVEVDSGKFFVSKSYIKKS